MGNDYRCPDFYNNSVDGDEVPVPHFGLTLTVEQFHALADRLQQAGVKFVIEPHLRFKVSLLVCSAAVFFVQKRYYKL